MSAIEPHGVRRRRERMFNAPAVVVVLVVVLLAIHAVVNWTPDAI